MTEQTQPTDAELYGDECPGVRGDTRAPRFGEWMRGVWASASNPHRDGMFVRTERRTGRLNPGTYHELTDGKGEFWSIQAKSTVFLTPQPTQAQSNCWCEACDLLANGPLRTRMSICQTCGDKRCPRAAHHDVACQKYLPPVATQAQAGAVPLTCEWTHNDDDGFWETSCGEAWRFDDGGPKENNMHFCHCCGKSLRIKGADHA